MCSDRGEYRNVYLGSPHPLRCGRVRSRRRNDCQFVLARWGVPTTVYAVGRVDLIAGSDCRICWPGCVGIVGRADSFGGVLLAVAVAAVVQAAGDIVLNGLTVAVRKSGSVRETALAIARLTASTLPLYTPVLAVLVYAYLALSPWTVLLFFVPAVAAQRLLVLYQEQRQLVSELANANSRLEASGLSFAGALVAALDARESTQRDTRPRWRSTRAISQNGSG